VLSAGAAAASLAEGFRAVGIESVELPVADGGEGTLDALAAARGGEWREAEVSDAFGRPKRARWLLLPDGTAAVEAAEAVPLDPARLDPMRASSRGLGELVAAVGRPRALLVCLGGTATVDGGAGLREVLRELPAPTRVACDVSALLVDAARVYAAQKGATPEQAAELEARLAAMPELAPYAEAPGAGSAGGLGAALAALGAELVPGSSLVLEQIGFDPSGFDVVVTGEGAVDGTTVAGKAPGEIARRCGAAGVRCVVFGGRVVEPLPGVETVALSGDPGRAREDLAALGERLGREL
ncbi:MAG: glycerate kinase, partial [Gaiellaceae bacterium]